MAAPGAPTGLFADFVTETTVELIWLAPESDGGETITEYGIEFSDDNGVTWDAESGTINLTFTQPNLTASTTYLFRVRAKNASGYGPYSDTITVTTDGPYSSFPPPGYTDISFGARLNELAGTTGQTPTAAANALAGTTGESLTTALNIVAGTTGQSATTALNIIAGTTGEPAAEAARKIGTSNDNVG